VSECQLSSSLSPRETRMGNPCSSASTRVSHKLSHTECTLQLLQITNKTAQIGGHEDPGVQRACGAW